jgi:hypothetical protein
MNSETYTVKNAKVRKSDEDREKGETVKSEDGKSK